jgi:uncharacterized protein with FMN-binding domain
MSQRSLFIAITILVATAIMSAYSAFKNHVQTTKIRNLPVSAIDLNSINNGDYEGNFCYTRFCYKVKVTVAENKITQIEVLNNRKTEYAEKALSIINKIIESQSLQVDAISGATISSKCIIKAVENALVSPSDQHVN